MRYIFTLGVLCWGILSLQAQNKIHHAQTYRKLCFLTIEKEGFEQFMQLQQAIWKGHYRPVLQAVRQMERPLKKFDPQAANKSFELWYLANYVDFDQQVEVVRKATLASLKTYKKRLLKNEARFFDHRQFMAQFLAYRTEAFYPHYWFMSQERFLSNKAVARIKEENEEGYKIFEASEFYRSFEPMDQLLAHAEDEMQHYLRIGAYGTDSTGIAKQALIPYSYLLFDPSAASYVLENFSFDDATMDLNTDREVRALKRFLIEVRTKRIYLIARFDDLPFGSRMHHLKARKSLKKAD